MLITHDHGARPALLHELEAAVAAGAAELAALHRHALLPPGKLLRPLLVVESALAVGGRTAADAVLPAAAALELLHTGSLVHDDIIDGDTERRGRAAVHQRFGLHRAVLGGDALLFQPFELLTACAERGVPADRIVRACQVLARAGLELCRGAALELDQAGTPWLPVRAYLRMAGLKTSPLLSGACAVGAILAGASSSSTDALARYGHALGLAFQARDDLLPYDTPPHAPGKPADSDLANGRPTLPVLLAYERADVADRLLIEELLTGSGTGTASASASAASGTGSATSVVAAADDRGATTSHARTLMAGVLRRTGAVAAVYALVDEQVDHCLRALDALAPGPGTAHLAALAETVRHRPTATLPEPVTT
ncbi:Polyprenyl synthetase [Actinobacteria bacterium OK074]|nr:Polyprenyl synthetase [Actinobacteria bacterium OK074]